MKMAPLREPVGIILNMGFAPEGVCGFFSDRRFIYQLWRMCLSRGKWKKVSPAADVLVGIADSGMVGLPVVLDGSLGGLVDLPAPVGSGGFPEGRAVAILSHSRVGGPRIVSASVVDVELSDRV